MTHAKFNFNQLMLTLIFGIWASEPPPPPRAWRMTEKAGPDRVKRSEKNKISVDDVVTVHEEGLKKAFWKIGP